MLARNALCRLALNAPKTPTHDLPQLARYLQRTLLARNASDTPAIRALSRVYAHTLSSRRSYATTTRATKPTATVKKAVKAQAAKKPAPKKTAATAKTTRKTTAKKPAARKAAPKRAAAKKAAPKKAAPKKRVKKVLTPEAKESATIIELKKKALKAPVTLSAITGFNAYVADMSGGSNKGETLSAARSKLADAAKNWKNLTPAEHEHYNHIANKKTAARRAEYKAWIESHTQDQIREANNARVLLRRKHKQSGKPLKFQSFPAHTAKLIDERHVKKPGSSYILFSTERWASGDFKNISTVEVARLIGNEWKALSAAEKKKYNDEFLANREKSPGSKAAASS